MQLPKYSNTPHSNSNNSIATGIRVGATHGTGANSSFASPLLATLFAFAFAIVPTLSMSERNRLNNHTMTTNGE